MKILVTGAAGFIGSHVARLAVEAGHEVRALHLPGEDLRNLHGLDCERLAGDVTDGESMRKATRGRDQVFHLAAIYALWTRRPERLWQVNVEGTRTVLEAARQSGVGRVVVTSSIARFGGQGRGPDGKFRRATEQSPFALSMDLYARSKAAAHELTLQWLAGHRELDVVLVAPTGPIGPGDVGPTPTGRLLIAALTLPAVIVTDTVSNFVVRRVRARGTSSQRRRKGDSSPRRRGSSRCDLDDTARAVANRDVGARCILHRELPRKVQLSRRLQVALHEWALVRGQGRVAGAFG